ncbi:hypothetical protein Glove_139g88 [Diversispora epigaea]|uniref:Uncharacterized protein n=1 Tax=Diversispora epigaea TaxID=1348612 RepID=A0A397IVH6_9GLOM|nr:hypothetical protein Glove_139g88 [Diversispora epigaea]
MDSALDIPHEYVMILRYFKDGIHRGFHPGNILKCSLSITEKITNYQKNTISEVLI